LLFLCKQSLLHLEQLSLFNFKNYEETNLLLDKEVNLIVGDNGAGKTNLLDAIHYLCISKSAFTSIEANVVKTDELFFSTNGTFKKDSENFKVICGFKANEKKILTVNGSSYSRVSEHIGRFPCVLIAPDHIAIIKEGSDERRKFFDNAISQIDAEYLENLITYNKYLKARNQLLKQFHEQNYKDKTLLEVYTEPLLIAGECIHRKRNDFISKFVLVLQEIYGDIASEKEKVELKYESQLLGYNFAELNAKTLNDDYRAQRTTVGTHLDDFIFTINGLNLRKFGSQGQQKTFLLALKIAQHQFISQTLNTKPIMLLDDIFDKLDDKRIAQLLQMCKSGYFGQVFITDARKDRTAALFNEQTVHCKIFEIVNGEVK
jgi:DNA replication and repair protein RecF